MIYLKPYKMYSQSAKMLQDAIQNAGVRCLRSRRRGIAWGPGIDKLTQFRAFENHAIPAPPSTIYDFVATRWLNQGYVLFARHLLNSHSGKGIEILEPNNRVIAAPFYTVYKPKDSEWRIHVCFDRILIQKKMKKHDWDGERDTRIRNKANGYVYGTRFKRVPIPVVEAGIAAVKALQLDIGAADVIWNKREQQEYVLEVNTAPGLSPSTAQFYAEAIVENQ